MLQYGDDTPMRQIITIEVSSLPYLIGMADIDGALAEGPEAVKSVLKNLSQTLRYERTPTGIKAIVVGVILKPEDEFRACIEPIESVIYGESDNDSEDSVAQESPIVTPRFPEPPIVSLPVPVPMHNIDGRENDDDDINREEKHLSAQTIQKLWRGALARQKISSIHKAARAALQVRQNIIKQN